MEEYFDKVTAEQIKKTLNKIFKKDTFKHNYNCKYINVTDAQNELIKCIGIPMSHNNYKEN